MRELGVTVAGLCVCVCLSVCLSELNLLLQGSRASIYCTYMWILLCVGFDRNTAFNIICLPRSRSVHPRHSTRLHKSSVKKISMCKASDYSLTTSKSTKLHKNWLPMIPAIILYCRYVSILRRSPNPLHPILHCIILNSPEETAPITGTNRFGQSVAR